MKTVDELTKDGLAEIGKLSLDTMMDNFKKALIEQAYHDAKLNVTMAARILEIKRTTLLAMLYRYGLYVEEEKTKNVFCPKCGQWFVTGRKATTIPAHNCVRFK